MDKKRFKWNPFSMFGEAPASARFAPDPQKTKELTMDDLKGIINEAVKTSTAAEIVALKAQIDEINKKAIFPSGENGVMETSGKSIVDTRFFRKNYDGAIITGDSRVDGETMAKGLRAAGGPYLKLSPAMEKFAEGCKVGFDPVAMLGKGTSMQDYNATIREANTKIDQPATGLTTTDVGALVPIEFLATIIEFASAQSQILPKLWRIPMGSLTMKIPKLAQAAGSYFGGITLYHPDEAYVKHETKPEFDYLLFEAKKLIGIIPLSDEVIMDSSINLINYITGLFVRAFQYRIEFEAIQGSGSAGQMLGILTDPGINLVPRQKVSTIQYEDIINLESALDENFQNLTYLSRRATRNVLRKQKDSVGQPVYHDGFTTFLGGALPPQLAGYPIILTRNIPALGIQGDLILADLMYYIWAVRQDMTIATSSEVRFFYDQTCVRFVMRMDGKPGVSIAFSALDNVPES